MASTTSVSSAPILEVLNHNNYKNWRLRIKTYLLAEGLWEVVEAIKDPAAKLEDNELEYKAWKQKNAKALYAIQNSCGHEMFRFISETETAKNAWEALEKALRLTGHVENSAEEFEPYIPFTEFVSKGDWDKAKECLKLKELDLYSAVRAINPRDGYGDTAIHVAARKGHVNIVKQLVLLMTQEDLKMKNAKGNTGLHIAALNGQLRTVKELVLLMGEEIDRNGDTALHLAVHGEKVDIVKELALFMRPKDLKIKNNNGYTALHLAVEKGNVPIVKVLAAVVGEVRGPDGDTALHIAVKMGATQIVKELVLCMRREDLTIKNDEGYTAIHEAARKGHVNIVKELVLLMTQEDLKMKNAKGNTALHIAALNGQVRTVKELVLLMGEEIDSNGDTALHLAVHGEKVDVVKELALFMRPKDLKIKNNNGYTALHLAVKKGNVPIVKVLAALVGEVRGPDGDTALHIAVKMGATQIVKELVLLMRREDLAIKNDEGYTAFHLAVKKGNVPSVKEFMTKEKERSFNRYTQFISYVANGDWDNAKQCLTKLDDPCDAIMMVDTRDGYGDSALHVAVRKGHLHIVKELISLLKVRKENLQLKIVEDFATFGSCLNLGVTEEVLMERAKYMVEQYEKTGTTILDVQNAQVSTALHIAVSKGNLDIVKELVLLMRKEDLEIKDTEGLTALLNAVDKGYIDIVKELVPIMRQEGFELKTAKGNNALHLAVRLGHINIAKEVMPFMRKGALEEKDGEGHTALGRAFDVGKDEDVMEIAKYMAENNNKVFGIRVPPNNWIPVTWAIVLRRWDLCCYLYPLTPFEYLMPEHGKHGAHLISHCLRAKKLDMALDLLRRCRRLAISPTKFGRPPIVELAGMHSAFLSGTQLGFWQYLIYNRLRIEPANLNTPDTCINISKQEDDRDNQMDLIRSVITLYRELAHSLLKLLGVDRLYKVKWIHTRSIDVLCCISEMLKNDNLTSTQLDIIRTSIFKAVEHGHVEFVTHICEAHPPFVKSKKENKNIFHFAVECRQHKIYSLIHRLDGEDKRFFAVRHTMFPENMLHLAGKLSPISRFNHIRGAALQMQRELQWFKEVEDIVPEEMHEVPNSDNMTPRELFTKNHENLKEEAEKSMKGTATSCTVVGALIVTIMFAAAFTVPGANSGSTGYPMFLAKKLFLVFIISDTLSLVSSTTSLILFLGILTSPYADDDFLKNLPTKMMIGLFTLFLSIATMMIAFSSALIIMLEKEYSWAIGPCIFVASIPVASFIWLQFPLLIEIFWSTYGPGIFDKKAKPWIKL